MFNQGDGNLLTMPTKCRISSDHPFSFMKLITLQSRIAFRFWNKREVALIYAVPKHFNFSSVW